MIQNTDYERAVIGTMINMRDALTNVRPLLTPECFADPVCRCMFIAIAALYDAGKVVDIQTLPNELARMGSPYGIIEVLDFNMLDITGYEEKARTLVDYRIRRSVELLGMKLQNEAQRPETFIDELYSMSMVEIESAFESADDGVTTLGQAVKEVKRIVDENMRGGENTSHATKTGFSKLDVTGGFHSSDLIIIAGGTSQGKSSLAITIANNAINQGETIAYYSMEMTSTQLASRILSIRSKVSSSEISYSQLQPYDYGRVSMAADKLVGNELLVFDDKSTSNIDGILSSIRRLHHKRSIRGAFIDYLQILSVNNPNRESKEQLMADVARRLKNLAKELDIWIVALSQLNRDKDNPEPSIDRLRGSGQIAEAADQVIFVYRPEVFNRQFPEPFKSKQTHDAALIDVAKGRNTGLVKFTCKFVPQLTQFVDEESDEADMPFSPHVDASLGF